MRSAEIIGVAGEAAGDPTGKRVTAASHVTAAGVPGVPTAPSTSVETAASSASSASVRVLRERRRPSHQ
jgi:hypothetical protein